ncbi:hypothetical protein [Stutzerimonas stutzeri]|uniref:hypothetical protein n=1 Tax=Stutzerimonas stutzeri TaxID=316 RepID=UPI001BCDA339|nr:hypothetical protein [Stutzerimonas stutzeri]
MTTSIVIASGTDEQSEPLREVLCSVWPISRTPDQPSIGDPLFTNKMVLVGNSTSDRSSSTLKLPKAGTYLVDVGHPNGHSLRTTISVEKDQSYRLVIQTPARIHVNLETPKSTYSYAPKVISSAARRLSAKKKDLEVRVVTQSQEVSLYSLYEFTHNLCRPGPQSEKIFECNTSIELSHEVPIFAQDSPYDFQNTIERKWLVVYAKEKPQVLIPYPSLWTNEGRATFSLILGRNSTREKWSATLKLTDSIYGSLVEYLTRKDYSSAASITESERGKAATALYEKTRNPFSAAAAAYLMALSETTKPEHRQWIKKLSTIYHWLPDSAIALGWMALRDDSRDNDSRRIARDHFIQAWSRGLPYYTVGLHVLVDALTLLCKFDRDDEELRIMLAAAKAADVSCVRTEPFTTLHIARYLGLPRTSECSS